MSRRRPTDVLSLPEIRQRLNSLQRLVDLRTLSPERLTHAEPNDDPFFRELAEHPTTVNSHLRGIGRALLWHLDAQSVEDGPKHQPPRRKR